MKIRKLIVGLVLGGAVAVGGAVPAMAANHDGAVDSDECAFYYQQGLGGSRWDTNSATKNFYQFDNALLSTHNFITSGAGQGGQVKDQAESIWVNKAQTARTYFSREYTGVYDDAGGRSSRNFSEAIRNDNASFKWV